MDVKKLKTGMHVRMMGSHSIIKVLSTCSNNCDTGDAFWFKGEIIDLKGSKEDKYNFVGYKSEFNVDFAIPA